MTEGEDSNGLAQMQATLVALRKRTVIASAALRTMFVGNRPFEAGQEEARTRHTLATLRFATIELLALIGELADASIAQSSAPHVQLSGAKDEEHQQLVQEMLNILKEATQLLEMLMSAPEQRMSLIPIAGPSYPPPRRSGTFAAVTQNVAELKERVSIMPPEERDAVLPSLRDLLAAASSSSATGND